MIWDGKRAAGVQVYRGRMTGRYAGEHIVVYYANGTRGDLVDARVGLQAGDIWPNCTSSVHLDLLSGPDSDYILRSYKQLSEEARSKLAKDVLA